MLSQLDRQPDSGLVLFFAMDPKHLGGTNVIWGPKALTGTVSLGGE